jgi:heme exporter protein B
MDSWSRVRPELTAAWTIARKDLLIEFRTRSAFAAAAVFVALAVTIFEFAWDPTVISARDLAPGVLWVTFAFAAMLTLQRSFAIELPTRALDGLLTAPVARETLFFGKATATLIFVLAVQLIALLAVIFLYDVAFSGAFVPLVGYAVLTAVGLVAVGTVFAAVAANTRLAELLLPVLALPFFVPLVTAAAQGSAKLLAGRPLAESAGWLKLLAAYDLTFIVAAAIVFPFALDE